MSIQNLHSDIKQNKSRTEIRIYSKELFEERDENGNNALHIAIISQVQVINSDTFEDKEDLILFIMMMSSNQIKNAQNVEGNTPMHEALIQYNQSMLLPENTPQLEALIAGKRKLVMAFLNSSTRAKFDLENAQGDTQLDLLARSKGLYFWKYNIFGDVDVNRQNKDGDTAVHISLKHGNLDNVYGLLEISKINFALQNRDGDTPLHLAAKLSDAEFYEDLSSTPEIKYSDGTSVILDKGVQNNNGYTAADIRRLTVFIGKLSAASIQKLATAIDKYAREIIHRRNGDKLATAIIGEI